MKNLKNKFIISILFLILLILWLESYSFYSIRDTNSYVSLINWSGFLDTKNLEIKNRQKIKVWNTIKTVWEESLVVIEWWDNSITRLWWDTEIVIKENYITSDLSKIQISLNLVRWKTWNNLVSLFWKDSYFKQYVNDIEAWVRWTVFEVNKDKGYIYVEDHEVTLKNNTNNSEITIWKNKAVSIKTFTLIDLQEFMLNLKDKTWNEINKKFDKEFLLNLQNWITNKLSENNPINIILWIFSKKHAVLNAINSFDNIDKVKTKISKLNNTDKKYVYDKIFSKYQNLNFLSAENKDYDKKLYYKEILLASSYDEKNTESLIKNSLYDINDMVSSNNLSKLKESLELLVSNKEKIKNLNIDFNKYVDMTKVPDWLKESMIESLKPLQEIFKINLNFDSIKDLKKKAEWQVNQFLDNNFWWLIESIKKQ